jgi:uncharacterized protein involved in type VI secretion and phage assembly
VPAPPQTRASAELHVPVLDVKLNGARIDPKHMAILGEVRVVDALRLPDVCTLKALYAVEAFRDEPEIDEMPFEIGKPIQVGLGATEAMEPTKLFDGEITSIEPVFTGGVAEVTIRAYDKAHRMHRERRQKAFQQQSTGDIVKDIAGRHGLSVTVDSTPVVHEYMLQNNETDWEFVWRLADKIGYYFLVDGTKATFKKADPKPVAEMDAHDEKLHSFRTRLTATQQVDSVTVRAWDRKSKRAIVGQSTTVPQSASKVSRDTATMGKKSFGASKMQVSTEPSMTQEEATALAKAIHARLVNDHLTGEGTCSGNPDIKAGSTVKITGVGTKFSGTYMVSTTTHVIKGGGQYITNFSHLGTERTISGLLGAGSAGRREFGSDLVIGVVTNNNDPDKEGRVRVKFPSLSDTEESAWARVLTPDAGKDRGIVVAPQKDDEVLIGFEQGDTRRPYVLGSLHNGKDKPGAKLQNTNGSFQMYAHHSILMRSRDVTRIRSEKSIHTKSGGDTEMIVGGNFTLQTSGSSKMKTDGKHEIETGGAMTIKSQAGLEAEAMAPIKITGKATIEVSASATLDIKASGPLTIQGTKVDINGGPMVSISGAMIKLG